jgi:hypothetical protein
MGHKHKSHALLVDTRSIAFDSDVGRPHEYIPDLLQNNH